MIIQEKKSAVVEVLNQTNDTTLIEEIFDLLFPEKALENIDVEKLPGDLQKKIARAFEDYKSGN